MNGQRAAEIQAVLEGVPLPAKREELIAYGRHYDPSIVSDLEGLPEQEFGRLDEVRELLMPVPSAPAPGDRPPLPRESGKPPGGADYLVPFPADTGEAKHDAPLVNPPEKAIEESTARRERQKKVQQEGRAAS
jgi:hypothetical protein